MKINFSHIFLELVKIAIFFSIELQYILRNTYIYDRMKIYSFKKEDEKRSNLIIRRKKATTTTKRSFSYYKKLKLFNYYKCL